MQAARGTSLSPDDSSLSTTPPSTSHWPVFNVADMCINVAAVLVQAFRGVRLDGTRHRSGSRS